MPSYNLIWQAETGLTQGIPVRFFTYDPDFETASGEYGDIVEVSMFEFEHADGVVSYERHTVRENGCSQICLTKMPKG